MRGIDLVELPDAKECCGFGGTFAVKNADVSTAMLSDKMRAVLDTGAEVVCAVDSSCLMHIGGGLSRGRTGVRPVHLAEILASTEDEPSAVSFPEAARRSLARHAAAREPCARHHDDPRQARASGRASCPTGRSCGRPGPAIKDEALLELDAQLERLEARGESPPAAGCTGRTTAPRLARSWLAWLARTGSRRGREGQVDRHRRDRLERSARRRAGSARVETDLAELIIQLGDDSQSHILVPAIHQNRAEIRDIFRSELDLPDLPDDPPALTEAARLHLRSKFLGARMGVSGANFAMAETGTVCVVESEGNGRMCTTLPEVLVTIMGVEKVVPAWRDMEVFLQLLAALLDRRADEPIHVVLDRRARGRRPARVPPGAARQRPHPRARGRARAPGAALHSLQRLPERLPGLRAGRRTRLRVRLSRARSGRS